MIFFAFWKLTHSVMWSHSVCLLCTKVADLTDGTCAAGGLVVLWTVGVGRAQPWESLPENQQGSCAHLLQEVSFVPILCSVRTQQCQLYDICHPLSLGIVELESRKTHLKRQLSLTALVENVVWRPVLSAGKDSVSVYFLSLIFFLASTWKKNPKAWALE